MIDRSKKYWTGDTADDIDEWLRLYSEDEHMDVKPVICHACGCDSFEMRIDQDEGAIQVKCISCGEKKILLDGGDIWEDAAPRLVKCRVCKICKSHNVRAGFIRRESGSVKWVYIGSRCTGCGTLGSFVDWKVSYEPTDEMERNI